MEQNKNLSQVLKSVLTSCHAGERPRSCYNNLIYFLQTNDLRQQKIKENTELEDYQCHPTARISTMRGISGTPNL